MFAKAKEAGCKSKISLFFLILNIVIAFSLAIITAHMANKGCSKAYAAVAIVSFIYIVINILLIVWEKSWNRCFSFVFLFLVFSIMVVTLVGLGFAVYQSVCDVNACYDGLASESDEFFQDFRRNDDKKDFEDQYCDKAANNIVGQAIAYRISLKANVSWDEEDSYYIVKGWPIGFCVLQFILSLMHLILNFFNLYSCKGCKPQKKEELYITYF